MPAQPNILPSIISPPFQVPGQVGANTSQTTQQQRANQPWTLRLTAVHTAQTFGNGTGNILGFDTMAYPPTYKAVGGNLYNLSFANNGSASFPFSVITLPSYGYYDIRGKYGLQTAAGGAAIELVISIQVNGSNNSLLFEVQVGAAGSQLNDIQISDIIECNPGDTVNIGATQINTNSATLTSDTGTSQTFMNLRYLGLS